MKPAELPDEVRVFAERAETYCLWILEINDRPLLERLETCSDLLAHLYASALRLPRLEDMDPSERDSPDVSASDVPPFDFGIYEFFPVVFNPYDGPIEENDPVVGSLSDCLFGIYTDLMRGLLLYRTGSPEDLMDAVWEWRFHFDYHWGYHASEALYALYWATRHHKDNLDETE
jgi:hypothetical protein